MQQLETAGYLEKVTGGRSVSAKGRKFLDNIAYSIKDQAVETAPGLAKY